MHDRIMTESGATPRKKGRPFLKVQHGSAVVPIYKGRIRNWTYYQVSFYLNGKRFRRNFASLERAKLEAQQVAQKIMEGYSAHNDLRPHEREAYLAARRLLGDSGPPLLTVVEEYMQCRKRLGDVPLFTAIEEFLRRAKDVKLGAKVPAIVQEFLKAKAEDNASKRYQDQLAHCLGRFAKTFPGEMLQIKSSDIDAWLRGTGLSPASRNNFLRCIKVFFSFAKARSYLPKSEATEPELMSKVKQPDTVTEIFTPAQIQKLLLNAPEEVLPVYAIGAFAGLRSAELARLPWSAVDLDRKIIELRANLAKTASRRIIPISDNLAQWLKLLPRDGNVISTEDRLRQATALARKLGIRWPNNVLRHSYISYRLAMIQNANQVALEAGNSPAMIFKHYRELVTRETAEQWFAIAPPAGWTPPDMKWNPRKRKFSGGANLADQILG